MKHYDIIIRPLITEKTNIQKELSNQVSFEVDRRANRIEIRRAVEQAFKVRVTSVRTMQMLGKTTQRGRICRQAPGLEEGDRAADAGRAHRIL